MLTSGAIHTVAAEQPDQAANTVDEPGVDMLRVVGGILSRGTYGLADVEALRSMVGDGVDAGDCRFARSVIQWLTQSTTRTDTVWQRNSNAQH